MDYEYAKLKNSEEGFSTTNYTRYFYGPYSPAFSSVLDELERQGFLTLVRRDDFSIAFTATPRIKEFRDFNVLDKDVKQIADQIISKTEGKSLQEVKEEVYSLEIVKNTNFNDKINFLR